jgi:hypothetical protein
MPTAPVVAVIGTVTAEYDEDYANSGRTRGIRRKTFLVRQFGKIGTIATALHLLYSRELGN